MIRLKNIPDTVLNKHWDYFVASEGYAKIKEFSDSTSLRQEEKDLYTVLYTNPLLLKKMICGSPVELLECINDFFTLINEMPELKFSQLPTLKGIEERINTKNGLTKTERNDNKRSILKTLIEIDVLSVRKGFYSSLKFEETISSMTTRQITIKKIKKLYRELKAELKGEAKETMSRLFEVFNYKQFTESTEPWGAYPLTRILGVSVCPYCNRNYINTVETETGKTRPELDHFYPKSRFPILALSIYNLIPSCHTCNANLKGSIDFYSIRHMHPYEDDLIKEFEFFIKVDDSVLGEAIPNIDDFEVKVKPLTTKDLEIDKINNSVSTFKLIELYNQHKDIAKEILEKALYYNKTRLAELVKFFDGEGISSEEELKLDETTKRFILGNFVEEADIGRRTLAKYTKDIAMGTELKNFI